MLIDRFVPVGSRRHHLYRLTSAGVRTINEEGWGAFAKKVKLWLRLRSQRGAQRSAQDAGSTTRWNPQCEARLALILATKDLPGYNFFDPLGLAYLKSYTGAELPSVDVRIFQHMDALIESRPDCVGIGSTTQDFAVAQQYVRRAHEEIGCPVLLGGVHISLLPETLPYGAIGCIGEGEETLTDLMRIFLRRHKFEPTDLSRVNGLVYWDEEGRLVRTEQRSLMTSLDRLPLPDRKALGIKPGEHETLYMFTSRGCPYNCKFCVSRVHWRRYRQFSTDYVIRELDELVKKYRVSNIHFFDDLFIVDRNRLREIAGIFSKRHYGITTSCAVRANLVDDELCELLKQIRCKQVMFGAESFSEPVLRELKCDSVTVAQNRAALDTLHKHGISTNVSMIFDAPEETREDMIASWRAIFDNLRLGKINKVGWGLLVPYPGSAYWDLAVQRGICRIDMDWDLFNNAGFGFHLNDNITREEVLAIFDEWETKCYLASVHFRDEVPYRYLSKRAVFVRKEELVKMICERTSRDETDNFVADEYERFLKEASGNEKLVLDEGWETADGHGHRWMRKKATFFAHSSVGKQANLLSLVFFVPNVDHYKEHRLSVTLKIDNNESTATIERSGEHIVSTAIPFRSAGRFLHCEVICSNDFCPAEQSPSLDQRHLSIICIRFELSRDEPENVVDRLEVGSDPI
jgi:anaerobic magnesium-protoporphyrin IX monomethyl ester cyclase